MKQPVCSLLLRPQQRRGDIKKLSLLPNDYEGEEKQKMMYDQVHEVE